MFISLILIKLNYSLYICLGSSVAVHTVLVTPVHDNSIQNNEKKNIWLYIHFNRSVEEKGGKSGEYLCMRSKT